MLLVGFEPVVQPGSFLSFCSAECSAAGLSFSRPRAWRPAVDPLQPLNDMCAARGERFPLLIARLACRLLLDADGSAQQTLQVRMRSMRLNGRIGLWMDGLLPPSDMLFCGFRPRGCISRSFYWSSSLSQRIMLLAHVRITDPPRPWMEAFDQMRSCLEMWIATLPDAGEQLRAASRLPGLVTASFFVDVMSRLHINAFRCGGLTGNDVLRTAHC